MCYLFFVAEDIIEYIQDPIKHNIILRSKAKLIFDLIHVVTCDFSTPRLIDCNDASLGIKYLAFTCNTTIHYKYYRHKTSRINFHNSLIKVIYLYFC